MGVSTGASGAKGGIESVVRIMGRMRSDVLDHLVAVPLPRRRSTATWPCRIRRFAPTSPSWSPSSPTALADRARSTTALAA